jgi:hypothetical protein
MALRKNTVELNDNPIAIFKDSQYMEFVETKIDYSAISVLPDGEGSTNAYIWIYIMMESSRSSLIRKETTLLDAFSAIGGFMTVLYLLIEVIV